MKELQKQIDQLLDQAGINPNSIIPEGTNAPAYPFNDTGRILAYLLASDNITYDQFLKLQDDYSKRNKYLFLFEMSPRTFGETWAEKHIVSLSNHFIKETKKHNPDFKGDYDLTIDNKNKIRIEVKACRANNETAKGSLTDRALFHKEALKAGFKYHFQQVKPTCFDIFIMMGVCKDVLLYWVLTSDELMQTGKFGAQHRNENTGVEGIDVYEGQVFMSEKELAPYHVDESALLTTVLEKAKNI